MVYKTADYLDFDKTLNKCVKLIQSDKRYRIAFLIVVGINSGLRISDILKLKHGDLKKEYLELNEKKTKKRRRITINNHIITAYQQFCKRLQDDKIKFNDDDFIFISQKGSVFSVRHVNRELKLLLAEKKSGLHISTHTMRKTFGRKVFENNNENEKSLIYLSDIFNHSSVAITRRYLGIPGRNKRYLS